MNVEFAPAALIKMIHCNCSEGCDTLRCTCRKHGLVYQCMRARPLPRWQLWQYDKWSSDRRWWWWWWCFGWSL